MRPNQGGNRRNNNRRGHSGGHGGGHGGGHSRNVDNNRPRSAASLRNQIFDSNGPDTRVRGNAFQVHEKYLALAKDALSSGDRVLAENYLQHAEHYYRIVEAINEATAAEQATRQTTYMGGQPPSPPNGFYNTVSDMSGGGGAQTPLGSLRTPIVEGSSDSGAEEGEEPIDAPVAEPAVMGRR